MYVYVCAAMCVVCMYVYVCIHCFVCIFVGVFMVSQWLCLSVSSVSLSQKPALYTYELFFLLEFVLCLHDNDNNDNETKKKKHRKSKMYDV